MNRSRLTRRALLGSTFSLMTFLRSGGAGGRGRGQDRGIGGTGHIAENPDDRGIGGTGVIGTIRKFGSIIVNDMRIAYPSDTVVEIDGRTASPADLRVGQVVQVVAMPTPTGLTTRRISVVSEVIGPIEAIGKGALTVLGQSVSTQFISARGWKLGQWIAVSGLRKLDGTVVASHVQYRDDSIARVSGPVTVTPDGVAKIGGLALANLDASLVGQRVMADVGRIDGEPAAVKAIANPQLSAMPGVRRLSIEAYVERSGDKNRFGSGLTASVGAPASTAPAPGRAIVTVAVNPDGSLTALGQQAAQEPESSQPDRAAPRSSDQPPSGDKTTPAEAKAPDDAKTPADPKASAKTESTPASQPAESKTTTEPAATHPAAEPAPPPEAEPKGRRH